MKEYYNSMLKKSILVLVFSFGLIFAIATVLVWKFDLSIWIGVGVCVAIAVIQFLAAPVVIEIVHGVIFEQTDKYVSENVLSFINKTCKEYNIPVPKVGIVKDGNPNAFTYGYVPKNAKLVVTTGLLDILEEEEQKAVIAHELGHIKHYDFIAMMIISLIPMVLYQVYLRTKDKKADAKYLVAIGAYGAYILSGFLVLAFSRIREYYADRFSKEVMGEGENLKNALIKIAYGTASREKDEKPKVSCMAFTNNLQNDGLMLSTYKLENDKKINLNLIKWDLKNPWGKWYEINSTHPLTAKRILALDNKEININDSFVKRIPKFLMEAVINILPYVVFLYSIIIISMNENLKFIGFVKENPLIICLIGISLLVRYYYSYRGGYKEETINELLAIEEASPVKGIPRVVRGKVIGKGIPGLFCSEDLVIDDGTGIILVDYRQPLKIFEWIFGVFKVDKLIDKDVEVIGWYKRGIRPYFVCKYIIKDGKRVQCYNYLLMKICGYLFIILGIILALFKL
ncbi:M48 family metalloprotease [Clostridium sporogenes]|uniref:Peptidase M48 domain-containing protein n=1 Tax=Clostridium botulinum TaxID=1491 RepID=A0A6M0SZT7_CLOBO|nr:zinc metalloprotease HtpX [Clostridium sporogenes]NFA60250.1 hypothetical protein [Clostridium botulinum]NFI72775.1 hypothetical protein [Clostridium sporogenes]NFL72438.1 hypothetical protein [Clostridium sporogenes]NFM23451.1 hypothetical protein [Clostridium sporogenes]NFP60188.1 hypothetical protein [Clostridium sporogenes]